MRIAAWPQIWLQTKDNDKQCMDSEKMSREKYRLAKGLFL